MAFEWELPRSLLSGHNTTQRVEANKKTREAETNGSFGENFGEKSFEENKVKA